MIAPKITRYVKRIGQMYNYFNEGDEIKDVSTEYSISESGTHVIGRYENIRTGTRQWLFIDLLDKTDNNSVIIVDDIEKIGRFYKRV